MGEGLAYGEGDVWAAWLVHLSDHAYTHCDDAEPWAAIALPSRAGLHDRGHRASTSGSCPTRPGADALGRPTTYVRGGGPQMRFADSAIEHPERSHSTLEPFLRAMRLSRRLRRTRARCLLRLA